MVCKLISKSEFSRRAGVTTGAMTKLCKGVLKPAMKGKRVDIAHPSAREYLINKGMNPDYDYETPKNKPIATADYKKPPRKKKTEYKSEPINEVPEHIVDYVDMTLRELIKRFGTDMAFVDWLKATKAIEDINEKRLKNAQTEGLLVSKELIKVAVIDPVNTTMQLLLTDGAKTMAKRVTTMSKAGRDLAECEKFIIDQIASFIKPMKTKIVRNFKRV